ncbi:ribonuclease P protein subunit p20 [Onthophagus taurus]|uniref:ribonuclease P protein subunit p20 n=1 Tax=Onthophagus taurus TaxID=166361 RepID=UPI0039BDDBFF
MAEAGNSRNGGEKKQKKKFERPNHNFKKRQFLDKPELAENVIYVNTKSNINAIKSKCEKLMRSNEKEIVIYSLGAANQRGIVLALQLSDYFLSYDVSVNTLTTEIIDDLEPAADDVDYEIQKRNNSALRIRLIHKNPPELSAQQS